MKNPAIFIGFRRQVLPGLNGDLYRIPLTIEINGGFTGSENMRAKQGERFLPLKGENGKAYLNATPGPEVVVLAWD